ncbi:glycosyltransferase [Sphingobacterium puteale]|uniref:Glycosyltransferase n=1 Tax=Sphingobacterium puteale TaxID=2420510 RepID=A0A420VQP9_9SPHI|nr:glycosyltransferase [Sphingobacterium puteale]RKO68671.1 glycosyltransferase [Sphingobacterium puteale]
MNFLINCSNLRLGGGIQVAHSFINELTSREENIVIVCTTEILSQIDRKIFPLNIKFIEYNIKPSLFSSNSFLDKIVKQEKIECVFTVFGPSYWRPKVKHICGYAKPHYVYKESPFFRMLSLKQRLILLIKETLHLRDFKNNSDVLVSENEDVTSKLAEMFDKKIVTVSNNHHQIYDIPKDWDRSIRYRDSKHCYLLTISANYLHKNLAIIPKVIESLINKGYFNFKFVLTINESELQISESHKNYTIFLGKVAINQCPSLYEQSDFMFLPTLLECFSASYAEAMKMGKPIITSDLTFARGICQDAAIYFDPINPDDIADKIIQLYENSSLQEELIQKGRNRLSFFLKASERANQYIQLILDKTL